MKKLIALLLVINFVACQNPKNSDTEKVDSATQAATQTAAQGALSLEPEFERIPNDIMMKLWNECTLIDYIFHDLPFSMNQSEQASIRTNLTYIDQNIQPNIPEGCKPMARQMYQINGEIMYDADVYFDDKCKFYVFIDGDKKYANKMSQEGVAFFSTMIQKAMQARQQQVGQ